jgi:hypothetical protein
MVRIDDVHSIRAIASAARVEFVPRIHHCVAVYDSSDKLLGGVLFTSFMNGSVQMHCAGFQRGWITKPLLYLSFHFPFEQLKVKKVICLIPEWNWRSRNLALHLGFRIEHLVSDVFNHNDDTPNGMYIASMLRDDCRWLKMRMPFIQYAPIEKTGPVLPLAELPTLGGMH